MFNFTAGSNCLIVIFKSSTFFGQLVPLRKFKRTYYDIELTCSYVEVLSFKKVAANSNMDFTG